MRRAPRVRDPAPLIRYRVPSGRGATEQPNATGDGDARLTARLWAVLVLTGIAAGLIGAALMLLLFTVQHAAFGRAADGFETTVVSAGGGRRMAALALAGALGGTGWYLLRRATPGETADVDDSLWRGHARLSPRRSVGTSVISEIVVGLGASLGREAAPKLMGGVAGSVLSSRAGLNAAQRRLVVACGAGAGLAAVYNVPLGGALFTAEVLLGTVAIPVVVPAAACCGIATVAAWVYLPNRPTYLAVPAYHAGAPLLVWALVAGPVLGVAAVGIVRLVAELSWHRPTGRVAIVAPLGAFLLLGLASLRYPQLLGNGKGMAHDAFVGAGALATFALLALLKPVVTALCLGAGASGGLFTPVMSTGAVAGAALGGAWGHLWPGVPVGAYAVVGAVALAGAAMQAPLAALVLVVELTGGGTRLIVPMLAATVLSTMVCRHLDGYSIYSARLGALPEGGPAGPAGTKCSTTGNGS